MFAPEMCNNHKNGNRYPNGLMIYDQNDLEELIDSVDTDGSGEIEYDEFRVMLSEY